MLAATFCVDNQDAMENVDQVVQSCTLWRVASANNQPLALLESTYGMFLGRIDFYNIGLGFETSRAMNLFDQSVALRALSGH
jgi:hypothetical protein